MDPMGARAYAGRKFSLQATLAVKRELSESAEPDVAIQQASHPAKASLPGL